MNHHETHDDGGRQLGYDAVEHVARRAEDFSDHERQRIALTNEARINALRVEGRYLIEREHQLEERLRQAEPPGRGGLRKFKERYCWVIGALLTAAAFFFSLVAFQPYRLGVIGDLYCLGIALVTPFAVEEFLEVWKSEKVLKAMITTVFITAISGGALLAAIRGDLLARQVEQSSPTAVIDGDGTPVPDGPTSFYESTAPSLRMLMLFLAIAMDLGAGVAIHRALMARICPGEDCDKLSQEMADVRRQLVAHVFEITALTNEPAIFVARFWRDFYRALLTRATGKAITKWLGLLSCTLFLAAVSAFAQSHVNLVAALDLSASEDFKGPDEKAQFDKNLKGVERLLSTIEADTQITVIGITRDSFADQYILLRAEISPDPGYFGERLADARKKLVRSWQTRAQRLSPKTQGTDILGGIHFAGELFRTEGPDNKKILVVYSDMRHVTGGLNLEAPHTVRVDSMIATVQKRKLLTDLTGVTVYILGADAGGRQVAEWESLHKFWITYFQKAGATLGAYSMLYDPPKPWP